MTYDASVNSNVPARLSFRIPPTALRRLDKHARQCGLTRSEAIRGALRAYIGREEGLFENGKKRR